MAIAEFNIDSLENPSSLYKLCNSLIDSPCLLSMLNFHVPLLTSRNPRMLLISVPNAQHHFYYPIHSISRSFSNLSYIDLYGDSIKSVTNKIVTLVKNKYIILYQT